MIQEGLSEFKPIDQAETQSSGFGVLSPFSNDSSVTTTNFEYNGQGYLLGGLLPFELEPTPTGTPTPPGIVAADDSHMEPAPSVAPTPESPGATLSSTPEPVLNLPAELNELQSVVCENSVLAAHVEVNDETVQSANETVVTKRIEPVNVVYHEPVGCIKPDSYASVVANATTLGGQIQAGGFEFGITIDNETIEEAFNHGRVCSTIEVCDFKVEVRPSPEGSYEASAEYVLVRTHLRVKTAKQDTDGSIHYHWELHPLIDAYYSRQDLFQLMPVATATPTATNTPQAMPTCVPVLPTPTFEAIAPTVTAPTPTPTGHPVHLNPIGDVTNFTGAPILPCVNQDNNN